jgi:hypothetical protein
MTKKSAYLAYMLRLWQVDRQGQPKWRASLESPHTAERLGFADIAQLLAFLQEKTNTEPAGGDQPADLCDNESSL